VTHAEAAEQFSQHTNSIKFSTPTQSKTRGRQAAVKQIPYWQKITYL